jgi:hypothetical protein
MYFATNYSPDFRGLVKTDLLPRVSCGPPVR